MPILPNRQFIQEQRGLLRSILIYHGIPWRHRQLVNFYRQFIKAGDLSFDIGAHVGNRVRAWRALDADVVAVEPQPVCLSFLQRWYGSNPHVTLVDQAVGASIGHSVLHVSEATPTVSTLSKEWIDAVQEVPSFRDVKWTQRREVEITTLDALIERFGLPAFCKIDVEGYELEVLLGLTQPLAALSIEYVPSAIDTAVGSISRLDELAGYEYNWTVGEHHRWQSKHWVSGESAKAWLSSLPSDAGSGDLYARQTRS